MLESLPITRHVLSHPVRKFNIGSGDNASYNTMALMKKIIIDSSQDYYVRRWAEEMISGAGENEMERISSIYDYLKQTTKYVYDPDGLELIKTPHVSLQLIESGATPIMDCDDYVVLSLALLRALGFQVALRAGAYETNDFDHIYGLVKVQGQLWLPIDLTNPQGLGLDAPNPKRVYDMEV